MASLNLNAYNQSIKSGAIKGKQIPIGPPGPPKKAPVNISAFPIPMSSYQPTKAVLGAATSSYAAPAPAAPAGPSGYDVFAAAGQGALSENDALLSSLNSEYDYNRSNLEGQLGSLGTQRDQSLASLNTELEGVKKQVGSSKSETQRLTESNIADARGTAQDVQRQNRNTLRALGILGSSAAGDILSRPLGEFDKQRAKLVEASTARLSQLDDFMNQKVSEHSNAVAQIQSQYADLVGKIQNDLRFNDRQRADAVKSANAALQQRIAEIKQSLFNYQTQVDTMKTTTATGLAKLSGYQQPGVDTSALLSTIFSGSKATAPQQVGVAEDDQRKKLSSLYGI